MEQNNFLRGLLPYC